MIRPTKPRFEPLDAPAVLNNTADESTVDVPKILREAGTATPNVAGPAEPVSPPAVIKRRAPSKVYMPHLRPDPSRRSDRIADARKSQEDNR